MASTKTAMELVVETLRKLENTPRELEMREAMRTRPDDFTLRGIYADLLDDRGDPRAAGFRAIGMIRSSPCAYTVDKDDITKVVSWEVAGPGEPEKAGVWFASAPTEYPISQVFDLPMDWLLLLELTDPESTVEVPNGITQETRWTLDYPSTLFAEDHAALTFFKLPTERQEQLLRGER